MLKTGGSDLHLSWPASSWVASFLTHRATSSLWPLSHQPKVSDQMLGFKVCKGFPIADAPYSFAWFYSRILQLSPWSRSITSADRCRFLTYDISRFCHGNGQVESINACISLPSCPFSHTRQNSVEIIVGTPHVHFARLNWLSLQQRVENLTILFSKLATYHSFQFILFLKLRLFHAPAFA